jgi:3-oxoadipate enol-lactonase
LLTGIANDHTLWSSAAARLADDFRVLRIDMRGHGGSDAPPAPYSLTDLVDDVLGLWHALGVRRSVLAGLGLGGVVAVETALREPQSIMALVPVSCRAELVPAYAAIWPPMIEAAKREGVQAIAQPTVERWFSADYRATHPDVIAAMRAAILRTSLDGYLGCVQALLELDWAHRLDELRMPVLYVSGELDTAGAPPAVMQALADRTRGSGHVVLPGATHICVVCNPDAFVRELRSFLARVALL